MSVRAVLAVAAVLLGTLVVPVRAAADPATLSPRYAGKGWLGFIATGSTNEATDVDIDPSTVNSSRASLAIPRGAGVDWAGLYWGGDQAARSDGTPPHCAGNPAPAMPPALDQTGSVRLSIGDSPYQTVTASTVAAISTASGSPGYQAYADVTALLRPYGGSSVSVLVGNLQVATGPGCTGGWNLGLVYSFHNGPDPQYAPLYQSIAVYDTVLIPGANATLTGLVAPATGQVSAAVTSSVLTGGAPVALTVNTSPAGGGGAPGAYIGSSTPLPLANAATGANLSLAGGDSFAAVILAVSIALPVTVSLPITATFTPATVAVGAVAQLTLTVKNDTDVPDTGVKVTAPLPGPVLVVQGDPSYDPKSGIWSVGTIGAHATATLNLTVRITEPGSYTSSAQVTASGVNEAPAAIPAQATIAAEAVVIPPTDDPDLPQAASVAPVLATGWQPPPGILVGAGLFGLGLLLLLIMVVRRRATP